MKERKIRLVTSATGIVALLGAIVAIRAIAEFRHRTAVAQLSAEGAVFGTPSAGSGMTVCLKGEHFTDGHCRLLRDLKVIQELAIVDAPRITDAGIAAIERRSDVRVLLLDRTGVSSSSLQTIAQWSGLNWLSIPGLKANDSDLSHLTALPDLKILTLDGCPLQDADLETLQRLPNVLWLSLKQTPVSDAGLEELRTRLAHTRVVR